MTALEPIFDTLVNYFNGLLSDPSAEPDEPLLADVQVILRSKSKTARDLTLLKVLCEPILKIIYSEETTMVQKSSAIEVLMQLLPLYTYEDVVNTFGESVIQNAILLGRQHDLQKIVIQLLFRVVDPDESLTDLIINAIFVAISDPQVYYGVFDELHRAVVHLAKQSEKFRKEIMVNKEINDHLSSMKGSGISQSRLIDLSLGLLQYIPTIDKTFYLVPEKELLTTDDPLLFSFTIQAYYKLLEQQYHLGNLQFLENDMDEQLNYCARLFVDPEYGVEFKSDANSEYPEVLGQLSRTFPRVFNKLNKKYDILNYAIQHIKSIDAIRFLSSVDPMVLYNNDAFFNELYLNSETIGIFYNLANNEQVFKNKLDIDHFPLHKFNLAFPKLLWVIEILIQNKYILERLTKEWKPISLSIIKPKNPIADPELADQRKRIMEAILNSGYEMSDDLLKPLKEEVELARKGVYVMEPATETS